VVNGLTMQHLCLSSAAVYAYTGADLDESEDGDAGDAGDVGDVLPPPAAAAADATPATVLVFDLDELQMACEHRLERQWRVAAARLCGQQTPAAPVCSHVQTLEACGQQGALPA
jgi:hypothetical protein